MLYTHLSLLYYLFTDYLSYFLSNGVADRVSNRVANRAAYWISVSSVSRHTDDAPVNSSFCTHFISLSIICMTKLYPYTELHHITQQSQVNHHFRPIKHMTQLKVPLRNHHMNQLISQQRNQRLRAVKEVRPCSTNQTRMVGGMLLARMVGTSLTRQNGMIRVGNAWTVSSFDSDGTFGRAHQQCIFCLTWESSCVLPFWAHDLIWFDLIVCIDLIALDSKIYYM